MATLVAAGMATRYNGFYALSGEDPLGMRKGSSIGDGWAWFASENKSPAGAREV